jgi:putative ABC transport system permease protein
MGPIGQFVSVTGIGLRSLPARPGPSLTVVVGVSMVVAVFISVLAMASGFGLAMAKGGRPDRIVVLRSGADSESTSEITREAVAVLRDVSGVRRAQDGEAVLSAESMVFAPMVDATSGLDAFVTLRGVGASSSLLRPEIRLVEGRMFEPGARELIVGKAVRDRMKSATPGASVALPDGEWPIVGVYESGGDARESEMLTDADTLMNAYRKKAFSTATLLLESPAALDAVKAHVAARPDIALDVVREDELAARSSEVLRRLLQLVAIGVGTIMAIGAAFGAVNTMLTAVSSRSAEIGTLRALGFSSGAVVGSVLIESLALALAGAVLGTLIAWGVLNGTNASMMSGNGPSQVTFALHFDLPIAMAGIAAALLIGTIGGALPAFRAGTLPITETLRRR